MIEDAAYDALQAYLKKLDADAKLIDGSWPALVEINRAYPSTSRPQGHYATINLLTDRDLREIDCEVYEDRTIGGFARAVMTKARGVEFLFRVEIYAKRPVDYGRLFATALRSAHSFVELSPFIVRTLGTVTRAPELSQEQWQGKAHLDVGLAAVVHEGMVVDVIESGNIKFVGAGGADVLRSLAYLKD